MLRKVKIKKVPMARTGYQVHGSLANDVPAMGGADYNAYIGKPHLQASKYIKAVPRDQANLEAEGGETVYGDINGDGMPEHKIIQGPRHSQGGVPLKLPDDTFIFSDTKSMKFKEPEFLAMFGKVNGSYTPAQLAKQYDLEKYRKILEDPNSDVLARKTAELMLRNYTLKLGALALAQESKKGFPQGIPAVARPYMDAMGIKEEDVLPDQQITDTVKQLEDQENNQRSAATMASPTEEQDEQYGDAAEEAQMINSDRPVAQPEPEVDEAAGMTPEETQMRYGGMQKASYNDWLPEEIAVFTGSLPYAQDGFVVLKPDGTPFNSDPNYVPPSIPSIPEDVRPFYNLMHAPKENLQSISQEELDAWNAANPPEQTEAIIPNNRYGGLNRAEYGMPMGANPQNYQGRTRSIPPSAPMFYQSGGYLPKAQDGITVDTSGMTAEQRERALYDARTKKENAGKKITEVKDGKKYDVTYSRSAGTDVEGIDMKYFGNTPQSVAAAAQYKILSNSLEDPDVLKKLCDETITSLKDPRSYKAKDKNGRPGAQGQTWEQRGLALPNCDQVKAQFLQHQKRNLAFQGNQIDPKLFTDSGQGLASLDEIVSRKAIDPKTGKPITTREEAEAARKYLAQTYNNANATDVSINQVSSKIGIPLEASTNERALQQATFHGYAHMVDNMSTYDPELQYKARNFVGEIQRGVDDENSMQGLFNTKGVQISPIDDFTTADRSYYGNTTAGHLAAAGLDKYDVKEIVEEKPKEGDKPVDKSCPCKKSDGTVIYTGKDPNTGACLPCQEDVPVPQPAEWWLQDTIKTAGAFGDMMSIKKQMPWAPRVDLETPRPTFLDPTRELAANAEQANIQTQALGQFAGPQAMSSRASGVQGSAAKNAADILSKYNNANVNVANQFEMQSTNIRNQEQMANQGATQRLYDQNTIANQQFANAKLAMRNNLRNQYTNAMTNRAKTDALNQLYPQYAVSPGTGGFMHYTQGRDLTGQKTGSTRTYDEWLKYYKDQGMKDEDAINAAKGADSRQSAETDRSGIINAHYGKFGGQTKADIINGAFARLGGQMMKKGGYVYGDVTFPFLM
jgi:hypothetical protein